MALRHAREQKARVLAICNTNGSTIPRESDAVLYTHAGPEVAVASTKAFLTQVVACYLVGAVPRPGARHQVRRRDRAPSSASCATMPGAVEQVLETMEPVRELARELADANAVLFLGRHVGYPVALEGALKLKELAYMHAEGFAAGELKHGPIALIEEGTAGRRASCPSPRGRGVAARQDRVQHPGGPGPRRPHHRDRRGGRRGGRPVRRPPDPRCPRTPTLLAAAGDDRAAAGASPARSPRPAGHDVDQPRNLAKSVTVE